MKKGLILKILGRPLIQYIHVLSTKRFYGCAGITISFQQSLRGVLFQYSACTLEMGMVSLFTRRPAKERTES